MARAVRGTLKGALRTVLCLSLLFFLAVGVGPHLFHYRTLTVLSGSMRPTFAPGDMLLVTPQAADQLRVGQVITYAIPIGDQHVETHRVVKILRREPTPIIITKGDANKAADPWQAELQGNEVWRVRGHAPKLGLLINSLRAPLIKLLAVLVAPFVLVALWLFEIWRPQGSLAGAQNAAQTA